MVPESEKQLAPAVTVCLVPESETPGVTTLAARVRNSRSDCTFAARVRKTAGTSSDCPFGVRVRKTAGTRSDCMFGARVRNTRSDYVCCQSQKHQE